MQSVLVYKISSEPRKVSIFLFFSLTFSAAGIFRHDVVQVAVAHHTLNTDD